jgi:hypothetical protein
VSTTDANGKPSESKLTELEPAGLLRRGSLPVLPFIGRIVASFHRALAHRGRHS